MTSHHLTFLYRVNLTELRKHFKELNRQGKYISYGSKDFYGAILRSKKPLEVLDGQRVIINVRGKGRQDENRPNLTGVKVDFIEKGDPRVEKYGLNPTQLAEVKIEVLKNIPSNILFDPNPSEGTVFFYKRVDGASLLRFPAKE